MPPRKPALSAPFAHREFNGETLLSELRRVRMAQLSQKQLNEAVTALQPLVDAPVAQFAELLRRIQRERLGSHAPIVALLREWAPKVKSEGDARALVNHFRRLALTSAVLDGMRVASARLPESKGSAR
jgi:hypothetical protein